MVFVRGQFQEGRSFPDRETKIVQSREYRGRNVFLGIDEVLMFLTSFFIFMGYTPWNGLVLKLYVKKWWWNILRCWMDGENNGNRVRIAGLSG
jgi:hypothetical protein